MADAKYDYTKTVEKRKESALTDSVLTDLISDGFARKEQYGEHWEEVDINEVVQLLCPGAKPVVSGSKIIFYSKDMTKAVVADISGYLRIQDLTSRTKKPKYLDKNGKEAYNYIDSNGKVRGRSRNEFLRATHYRIKKRKV